MSIKNEHIVYAYGERSDGPGYVLLVGVTDKGLDLLRDKKTLLVTPPSPTFERVTQVVVFHEPTKEAIKETLRKTGLPIREEDLRRV